MMLVPAGFLVLIILGALAVDSAGTYLAQQQLRDSLTAAANDAVGAGLSSSAFYSQGLISVDPARAAGVVCLSVAAQPDGDLHQVRLWMATRGDAIRLRATATVHAVFGRAIPGFGVRPIQASTSAVAESGPSPLAPTVPTAAALEPITCP
jgi:hypothetical protein